MPEDEKDTSFSMPSFEDIMKRDRSRDNSPKKKEFLSDMVEKLSRSGKADKSDDMPSLDLGSQILAQQRKAAAVKRKSPGGTGGREEKTVSESSAGRQFSSDAPASPQQKIITDIVSAHIDSLLAN